MEWRLLRLEVHDAYTNMAIDEAILTARAAGAIPNTLRLYRWRPSAVSIGRFQDVYREVHVDNCRRCGVDIVRRITGGGAVYHDHEGEITYSVVVDKRDLGRADIVSIYRRICGGLVEAAKILGVNADFHPGDPRHCPNILVKGRKISGSAQCHRGGVLLQHGTFLLDLNLEEMFTFLRVPWARSVEEVVCVARNKLTSIRHELGREVSVEEACQALVAGFQRALGVRFVEGRLTSHELKLARRLRNGKFSTEEWNFMGRCHS